MARRRIILTNIYILYNIRLICIYNISYTSICERFSKLHALFFMFFLRAPLWCVTPDTEVRQAVVFVSVANSILQVLYHATEVGTTGQNVPGPGQKQSCDVIMLSGSWFASMTSHRLVDYYTGMVSTCYILLYMYDSRMALRVYMTVPFSMPSLH